MRPTIDGLNADQWFHVASVGACGLLIGTTLWMVGRYCVRAVRFLRAERLAEQARRKAHAEWLAERERAANAPERYIKEQRPTFRVIHND
jgi:hypothetical protein